MSLRIRKGDKVKVMSGKDKGKTGKVLQVFPRTERALVEGVNMAKKHLRRSQQNPHGAVVSQELPIRVCNLALIDPVAGKPCRIKTSVAEDGSKQRIASKSKSVISG